MSNVIFCKTRYQDIGYASYTDYFRLVELAGYPCIYVDELDPQSDNIYIVTPLNGEWVNGWQNPRARIIHHELEWRTDWRAEVNEPPGISEVWSSDAWNAEQIGAKYVPLGSHDGLKDTNMTLSNRIYDIALLAYQTGRRQAITHQLEAFGLEVAPPENQKGFERSVKLMQSKLMCHVHQNPDTNTIAPLRWCLAAAHNLPLLSEMVNNPGIFTSAYMFQAAYANLAPFAKYILDPANQYQQELDDKARNLHNLLCVDWTFRECVEAALAGHEWLGDKRIQTAQWHPEKVRSGNLTELR